MPPTTEELQAADRAFISTYGDNLFLLGSGGYIGAFLDGIAYQKAKTKELTIGFAEWMFYNDRPNMTIPELLTEYIKSIEP